MSNKPVHKGFTLVELIVYLGLVTVILVSVTTFAWNVVNGKMKSQSVQEVGQNGRFSLERITQDVHGARGLNVAQSTFGVNPSRLSLQMRGGAANPTVFDLDSATNRLRITQGVQAPQFLTSDEVRVTEFIVENRSVGRSENIEVHLTIERVNPSGSSAFSASESWETAIEVRDK